MPRIKILPETVASQIAAGEVVQRPASVVKELVDNGLDAGAGRIVVEVEKGGNQLVRVADDGCGMSEEDLPLCLRRHATSKIELETDLHSIRTHGFRGEALAAISSVSKTEIVSRLSGERKGCRLYAEGGEILNLEPVGAPPGTSVTVSDLFYNTPARKKFMKSATTEMERVGEVVVRAALGNPNLHFELSHNGRRSRHYPPVPGCADRLVQILGEETAAEILTVNHATDRIQIEGFISRPTQHRKSAADLYFFVNRRFVRDRILMRALAEAYRASLPQRRYPVAVLFLELPPEAVDVNVHPTKEEIRFLDEGMVWRSVYAAVRDALSGFSTSWGASGTNRGDEELAAGRRSLSAYPDKGNDRPVAPPDLRDSAGERPATSHGAGGSIDWRTIPDRTEEPRDFPGPSHRTQLRPDVPAPVPGIRLGESQERTEEKETPRRKPSQWKVVSQIFNSFILCEAGEEMALFDQHALHERLQFEKLRKQYASRQIGRQNLLFPTTIEVSPNQVEPLTESLPLLLELGLEIEPFGDRTFVVRGIPSDLDLSEVEGLIQDALHDIAEQGMVAPLGDRAERILARMACRSAVKANEPLNVHEMQHLVDQFTDDAVLSTCPHGRPPIWRLARRELEKLFDRP